VLINLVNFSLLRLYMHVHICCNFCVKDSCFIWWSLWFKWLRQKIWWVWIPMVLVIYLCG
jgi:hypothetical protein